MDYCYGFVCYFKFFWKWYVVISVEGERGVCVEKRYFFFDLGLMVRWLGVRLWSF